MFRSNFSYNRVSNLSSILNSYRPVMLSPLYSALYTYYVRQESNLVLKKNAQPCVLTYGRIWDILPVVVDVAYFSGIKILLTSKYD